MFQEQPLWTIHNLQDNLKSSPDKNIRQVSQFALKKALSQLTFLFKNGPFKFAYCYYKYDPRLDFKSIKFQTFNIGVNNTNFMTDGHSNSQDKARKYLFPTLFNPLKTIKTNLTRF